MIEFLQTGNGGAMPPEERGWVERSGGGAHRPLRRPPPNVLNVKDDDLWDLAPGRAVRRLRDLQIHFISLVPAAANARTVLVKSAARSGRVVLEKEVGILKADAYRHMVYGVVYAPDEVDTEGDTIGAAEIEQAAYAFMREGRTGQIDSDHDGRTGKGYVAESWMIRPGDPLFPDETAGAWAVGIKVTDAATWARVERGELRGISMAGLARPDDPQPAYAEIRADTERQANAGSLAIRLRKLLGLDAPVAYGSTQEAASPVSVGKADVLRELALDALQARTEQLAERLDAVERHTPGRQTRLGGAPVRKGKDYKGLGII